MRSENGSALTLERVALENNQWAIRASDADVMALTCSFARNAFDVTVEQLTPKASSTLYTDAVISQLTQRPAAGGNEPGQVLPPNEASPADFLQSNNADFTALRKVRSLPSK